MLLREGLARLLEAAGFEVVGQAGDADELLRKVAVTSPDVAIVDIRMPPTHTDEGLRAARDPRGASRTRRPRALAVRRDRLRVRAARRQREGVGYLLKDRVADLDEFVAACGGWPRAAGARSGGRLAARGPPPPARPARELTAARARGARLMAEGRSNHAIGERLVISERAVEKHVTSIFAKLGSRPPPDTTAACSRCSPSCAAWSCATLDGYREPHLETREGPIPPSLAAGLRASGGQRETVWRKR